MNIEEAKQFVDSSKVVKLFGEVINNLPYVNWKGYAVVCGYDGKDNTFSLIDFYTNEHLGWFNPNTFRLLDYEYIDDYEQAVKEYFDGKYLQVFLQCGVWGDLIHLTLKELKLCDKFRVKYN